MYQKEKETLVSVISSVLILGIYSVYVYQKYLLVNPSLINDFKFWGKAFLILIPVSIGTMIVIHIIFAIIHKIITREEITDLTDERDRAIELRAIRISHWIFILGFLLSMASQAIGMQPWVMFVTLIYSGFLASIISEIVKLYYYRRGF